MANREEWCAEKSSNLIHEELRVPTLMEIKEHLETLPAEEAGRTAKLLRLPLVFDCLNDSNMEQVDLACDVLTLCMKNLKLGETTNQYEVSLERALKHPHASVKLMALNEISRNTENDELLDDISKRISLLISIVNCIADNELAVAKEASHIVARLCITKFGIQQVLSADVVKSISDVMATNSVVRLRVYELLVTISNQSKSNHNRLEASGLLNHLLNELDNNDILLRTNVVEILSKLVVTEHGYDFLESNRVLTKLFQLFDDDADPLTVQLCEPEILRFFGHVVFWKNEVFMKYPKVVNRLFENVTAGNITIVGVSLDAIGHIGSKNEGKLALESTGNKVQEFMRNLRQIITNTPTEIKLRAFNCLELLLTVKDRSEHLHDLTNKWFNLLGPNPIDFILNYAKNPFPEIRIAGLGIINVISQHVWGQELIRDTPGLLEFLMDRNVETVKDSKVVKFEIIEHLASSDVFDHSTSTKLKNFVKEGPFYVQAITEIAIEGNE